MAKQKLNNIASIKTIMTIIIVFYHSCIFFTGSWFTKVTPYYNIKYIDYFIFFMSLFHIHTFVMASGYLFYYLNEKNDNSIIYNIKKRFNRLLIPYVFTSLLWTIPFNIYFFNSDLRDLFINFVLCKAPAQLWFLIMLFGIFVLFEFFLKQIKITNVNFIILFIITLLLYFVATILNFNYFQIASVFKYIIFFYLGGYLYYYKSKFNYKINIFLLIINIIFIFLIFILKENDSYLFKFLYYLILQLISLSLVTLIFLFFNYIFSDKISTNNTILKKLEENSFGIYLFHQQIIYILIILLNGHVFPFIQILITFVISLSVSFAISYLLKKNKFSKKIFGL